MAQIIDTSLHLLTTDIRSRIPFWGVCSNGEAEKAVTALNFTNSDLVEGAVVFVRFTMTDTGNPEDQKLNVNCTGAKPVKVLVNGQLQDIQETGYLEANKTYMFVYDGTNWIQTASVNTTADCFSITLTNPTFPVTVQHSRITAQTKVLTDMVLGIKDISWTTSEGQLTLTSATPSYTGELTLILANDIDVSASAAVVSGQ